MNEICYDNSTLFPEIQIYPQKETAMNRDSRFGSSNKTAMVRPWVTVWKRTALAVIAAALVVGLVGCSLDDLLTPVGGDIPFEKESTTPPEMGAVDNIPTVPEDISNYDDAEFRPFLPG